MNGKILIGLMLLISGAMAWWNHDWDYRMNYTISSNVSVSNYVFRISIDTQSLINGSKLNGNCSDLRIVYHGNSLPYWIEDGTCNTTHTFIWVKGSLVNGNNTYSIYYHNPSAPPKSNATAVWDFFDSFDNLDQWDSGYIEGNNGYVQVENGILHIHEPAGVDSARYVSTKRTFKQGFDVISKEMMSGSEKYKNKALGYGDYDSSDTTRSVYGEGYFLRHVTPFTGSATDDVEIGYTTTGWFGTSHSDLKALQVSSGVLSADTWYLGYFTYDNDSNIVSRYEDYTTNSEKYTLSTTDSYYANDDKHFAFIQGQESSIGSSADYYVDWVGVRQHEDVSLTTTQGNEEHSYINISLIAPANNSTLQGQQVTLRYNLTFAHYDSVECKVTLDNFVESDQNIDQNGTYDLTVNVDYDTHHWYVTCENKKSETWVFVTEPQQVVSGDSGIKFDTSGTPTRHYCLNNKTLAEEYIFDTSSGTQIIKKYVDCKFGCDQIAGECKQSYIASVPAGVWFAIFVSSMAYIGWRLLGWVMRF